MEKLQLQLPNKEKLQFFLLFVLLSFIFWTITKFSNTYQLQRSFEVTFSNVPDYIVLEEDIKTIDLTITSSGFQMFLYEMLNKKITLPFDATTLNEGQGTLALQNQFFDIQKQLYENTVINSFDTKNLVFDYFVLTQKRLPLKLEQSINFRPGFLLDEGWKLSPDSIWVYGSAKILDTLTQINVQELRKQDVFKDIADELALQPIAGLRYSKQTTLVEAKVARFSEISFQIPIQIEHLPKNVRVKLFPQRTAINIVIRLDQLDKYQAEDFTIACDYLDMINPNSKSVSLYPVKTPEGIKKISWNPKTVDFLIRQ